MATILGILGVVLAFLAGVFANGLAEYLGITIFKKSCEWIREQQRSSRRSILKGTETRNWLMNYYEKNQMGQYLYEATIVGATSRISFIAKSAWYGTEWLQKGSLRLAKPLREEAVRVRKSLIAKRKWLGYRLHDDPLFSLVEIVETCEKTELVLGLCRYYQFLSTCGLLEEETISIIQRRRWRPSLRDRHFRTVEAISTCPMGALGIGVQCVLAFKKEDGYWILLQDRAFGTVSHGGLVALVPTFAFQPLYNDVERECNLEHQFFREYYEELYDREEMIRKGRRLCYNWFYEHEPVARLTELKARGKLHVLTLGFGFDAHNCEPNLAILVRIDDEGFWTSEEPRINWNWEINDIHPYSINDPKLGEYLRSGKLQPGSAFALSEAMAYLGRFLKPELG